MEMKKGSRAAGIRKGSAPKKDRIGPMRPIKTGQRPKSNSKKTRMRQMSTKAADFYRAMPNLFFISIILLVPVFAHEKINKLGSTTKFLELMWEAPFSTFLG